MQTIVILLYVLAAGFLCELFNMWVDGKRVDAEVKQLVKYLPKTQEELDRIVGRKMEDK